MKPTPTRQCPLCDHSGPFPAQGWVLRMVNGSRTWVCSKHSLHPSNKK